MTATAIKDVGLTKAPKLGLSFYYYFLPLPNLSFIHSQIE